MGQIWSQSEPAETRTRKSQPSGTARKEREGRGGPGVASDGSKGGNSLDAVTPGLTPRYPIFLRRRY